MAATTTFGKIETRIRRDLLNDNAEPYRWGVAAVMSAMNTAVVDIAQRHNAWAGHDESGNRIYNLHTSAIEEACEGNPPSTAITGQHTESSLRALVMPLDDRYAEAVAYLAASRLLMLDDSDTNNAAEAARLLEIGKDYAQR